MPSPDTSAQAAPVASQEAEAREWEIAESEFQRGYAAGRASERERYAELVAAVMEWRDAFESQSGSSFVERIERLETAELALLAVAAALAALEEAESA